MRFVYRWLVPVVGVVFGLAALVFVVLRPIPAHADITPLTPVIRQGYSAVSANEQYLVYMTLTTQGWGNLYSTNLTTGETVALRSNLGMRPGDTFYITPDSAWVYFTQGVASGNGYADLYRVPIAGGRTAELVIADNLRYSISAEYATVSPNEGYFAVSTTDRNNRVTLYNIDVESGAAVSIEGVNGYFIATLGYTADSTALLYRYQDDSTWYFKRGAVTGGTPTTLNTAPYPQARLLGVSPDLTAAYLGLPRLYRVPFNGGALVPIGGDIQNVGNMSFSPDGQYGFFFAKTADDTTTLFRLTLATDTLTPLHTSSRDLANNGKILVAATGNLLVVIEGEERSDLPRPVYSIDYQTPAAPILLTDRFQDLMLVGTYLQAIISADGQDFLFMEAHDNNYSLSRVPLDGSGPVEALTPPIVQRFEPAVEGDALFLTLQNPADPTRISWGVGLVDLTNDTFSVLYHLIDDEPTRTIGTGTPLSGHRTIVYIYDSAQESGYRAMVDRSPIARFTTRERGSVAEGAPRGITVEMLPPPTETITVSYSIMGGTATADEVTLSPNPLVFAPGQATQTITITAAIDDDTATEHLILGLNDPIATDPTTITVPIVSGVRPVSDAPIVRTPDHAEQALATTQDGSTVVLSEKTPDGAALVQYDLATGTKTILYDGETRTDIAPVFTSDEQSVFFATPTEVRRAIRGGGTTPVAIATEGCMPAIHIGPTNEYALVRLTCESLPLQDRLLRVNLTTNAVTTIATAPSDMRIDFANITPDGRVVYVLRRYVNGEVYQQPIVGGAPELLGTIQLDGRFVELSPDGTVLFYKIESTIYRWRLGAVEPPQALATSANGHISLTPHGEYLLYTYIYKECPRGSCTTYYNGYLVTANGNSTVQVNCSYSPITGDWHFTPDGNTAIFSLDNNNYFCALPLNGSTEANLFPEAGVPLAFGNTRIYAVRSSEASPRATLLSISREGPPYETLFTDTALYPHTATGGDVLFFSDADGYLYASAPTAPPVGYTADGTLHAEGDQVEITVSLGSTPLHPVTVDYALTGGTATEGEDFTFTPGTLTFAPFERTKTFTVEVLDDGVGEAVETAVFTLSNIQGGSAGEQTTYTLRIADDVYIQTLPVLQR